MLTAHTGLSLGRMQFISSAVGGTRDTGLMWVTFQGAWVSSNTPSPKKPFETSLLVHSVTSLATVVFVLETIKHMGFPRPPPQV